MVTEPKFTSSESFPVRKRLQIAPRRSEKAMRHVRLGYRAHVARGLWAAVSDATARIEGSQLSVEDLATCTKLLCNAGDALRELAGESRTRPGKTCRQTFEATPYEVAEPTEIVPKLVP